MTTTKTTNDLTLPCENVVALAGDWHGDSSWAGVAIPHVARMTGARTILHAGDFGFWPPIRGAGVLGSVDYWCKRSGVERILVTPGNHEHWANLNSEFAKNPGGLARVSETVYMMPRGYRFSLGDRSFLSLGGAASLDAADRVPLISWFADEVATDAEVDQAIAGGPVDVLLLHETINDGAPLVERIIRANPMGWNEAELAYSASSRQKVTRLTEAVTPKIVVHGHIHVQDETITAAGTRLYSLNCEDGTGNLASLDLVSGDWEWLGDPRRR